jgi:hypothetical protein
MAPRRDRVREDSALAEAGEASHPEREPPEMLDQLRRTLG